MPKRPLAAYSPQALADEALTELFFGSNTYSIGVEDHARAAKVNIPWQVWIIQNNFETIIHSQIRGSRLVLFTTPAFDALARGLGYNPVFLDHCVRAEDQAAFITALKEKLK